jgi:hypothetical protein
MSEDKKYNQIQTLLHGFPASSELRLPTNDPDSIDKNIFTVQKS